MLGVKVERKSRFFPYFWHDRMSDGVQNDVWFFLLACCLGWVSGAVWVCFLVIVYCFVFFSQTSLSSSLILWRGSMVIKDRKLCFLGSACSHRYGVSPILPTYYLRLANLVCITTLAWIRIVISSIL